MMTVKMKAWSPLPIVTALKVPDFCDYQFTTATMFIGGGAVCAAASGRGALQVHVTVLVISACHSVPSCVVYVGTMTGLTVFIFLRHFLAFPATALRPTVLRAPINPFTVPKFVISKGDPLGARLKQLFMALGTVSSVSN